MPESSSATASRPAPEPGEDRSRGNGFGSTAVRGSLWMTAQAMSNKLASAASMYFVARELDEAELGLGALVLSIAAFAVVLPPLVMCDVLVARQDRLGAVLASGRAIALKVGLATSALICLASPGIALLFPKFPFGTTVALICIIALRSLTNAAIAPALALLRSDLRYSRIVAIDGATQLASTLLTLALAFSGAGAAAIVVPQLAASALRAILYTRASSRCTRQDVEGLRAGELLELRSDFRHAALAQYVHSAVGAAPLIILGRFSTEVETGIYGFAFMLATQATVVVAYQLGIVLQPIFGRLSVEPARQVAGYLRAVRAIGGIAVPISLLQCVLAEPLFALLFSPKWDAALRTFQILSIAQAFHFGLAPTLALLKAQGRFRTVLLWQFCQLLVTAAALPLGARHGGASGAAAIETAIWGVSIPTAMLLAGAPGGLLPSQILRIFIGPWLASVPIATVGWMASRHLTPLGTGAQLATILIAGPLLLVAAVLLFSRLDPSALEPLGTIGALRRLRSRLPSRRGATASPDSPSEGRSHSSESMASPTDDRPSSSRPPRT